MSSAASRIEEEMTDAGKASPRQIKGGVFAPADIKLIKEALSHYARLDISDLERRQIANLLHRLNNRI